MRDRKILLLSIVLFASCSGDITSTTSRLSFPDYASLAELLEDAYQHDSQNRLDDFIESWMDALPAYISEEVSAFPDTVQQVYGIFQEFYSPTNLNRLTGGSHENFETEFRYVVVQNELQFAVVDTLPRYYYYRGVTIRESLMPDFRPPLDDLSLPVVYLSAEADSMIYRFLYQADGERRTDHQSRVDFLRQAMQLTHHHWFSDYHKATMPVVSHIYVDESLSHALVNFRVFYQFGEAYLERKNSGWTLLSSELRGIE